MEHPLTVPDTPLSPAATAVNRSVPPLFGKNGKALTLEERTDIARRRGICVSCGIQTHKITLTVSRKITNSEVYKGDCIRCNQELVPPVIYTEWKQKHQQAPLPRATTPPPSRHRRSSSLDHCEALTSGSTATGGPLPTHIRSSTTNGSDSNSSVKPTHRRIHSTSSYDALNSAMSIRSSGSYEPIVEVLPLSHEATHKRISSASSTDAALRSLVGTMGDYNIVPIVEAAPPPPPTVLTVFEASPLAYEDEKTGHEIALPALELEKESSILQEALKETTGIQLVFQTATTNNLSAFLSHGQHQLLHLSCHGHQNYLFIENDYGGAQQLLVNDHLRPWIRTAGNSGTGSSNLRFVFVSACHSRSAGDAFVDAGIEHVVCCEQDTQVLNNTAAMIFTRDFYRSLAFGRTLQQAFDLAIHAVILSPELKRTGLDTQQESKKFILLPKTTPGAAANHDIVFFPSSHQQQQDLNASISQDVLGLSERSGSVTSATTTGVHPLLKGLHNNNNPATVSKMMLPLIPPRFFVGRELDIYHILKSLFVRECRVVRITGAEGMGKVTLAKAAGHYIAKRKMWGDILAWLPSARKLSSSSSFGSDGGGTPSNNNNEKKKDIISLLLELFAALTAQDDETFDTKAQDVLDELYEKKATIIINTRDVPEEIMPKLSNFLDDIFERTKHVKVILACSQVAVEKIKSRNVAGFSCPEAEISLKPLDYNQTVTLFGKICQHSSPNTWSQEILHQKKSDDTFRVMGQGNPASIRLVAKTMTRPEYDKLVQPGRSVSCEDFQSSINMLHQSMPSFGGEESTDRGVSLKTQEEPSLRSQAEIIEHFLPLLKEGKVYRKNVTSFIRKAKKGEHIVTAINGVTESQLTVKDDTSWVVCARSAGEYYVVTDRQFRENYDQSTARVIETLPMAEKLRREGFLEYSSRRKVWAYEVNERDMRYLQHKEEESAPLSEAAHFMAPWDEPVRVELRDYLATTYGDEDNVEIYRIERAAFECTYIDCTEEKGAANNTTQIRTYYILALLGAILAVAAYFIMFMMGQTND